MTRWRIRTQIELSRSLALTSAEPLDALMHRTRSVDLVPHHHRWSYRGAVRSQKIRDSDGLLCGLHTHSEPIVQFQVMSSMNGSHHGMSEHHQKFMTRICMNEAEL